MCLGGRCSCLLAGALCLLLLLVFRLFDWGIGCGGIAILRRRPFFWVGEGQLPGKGFFSQLKE